MTAREYFEGVRGAVSARERCIARISALRAAEGIRYSGMTGMPHGTGVSDPMRATDARMDAERAALDELRSLDEEIARGYEVCRGVRAALPSLRWGDALEARYCMDAKWDMVARMLGVTRQQAQRDVYAALDWVDMVGVAAARQGCGQAALF